MPDGNGICDFVLDPDDHETWGGEKDDRCYVNESLLNESGVWTCPHTVQEGEDLCIFHLPVERKDDGKAVNQFLEAIETADDPTTTQSVERRTQFLGAKFGTFDITEWPQRVATSNENVLVTHSKISGNVDLSEIEVDIALTFAGTEFEDDVVFKEGTFGEHVDFRDVEFAGESDFTNADFRDSVHFSRAEFCEKADFQRAEFTGVTLFNGTDFCRGVNFKDATFRGEIRFNGGEFYETTVFDGAEFGEKTGFLQVAFHEGVSFNRGAFHGDTDFGGAVFEGKTDFHWAAFDGYTIFNGADFGNDVHFTLVEFGGQVDVIDTVLDGVNFRGADLTGADFTGASLCNANLESALLSRATLFGADVRGAKLSGVVLGDVRIDEGTQFLGHPEDERDISPHTLSAIRSKQCCVYDPDYEADNEREDIEKAKSVYRAIEELSGKAARSRLQARCFVRRQDLQKKDYWDVATDANSSLEERTIASARWSRARIAELTLLYGESPWRIIAYSLGTILAFGLVYPLGGWVRTTSAIGTRSPVTYERIAQEPILLWKSIYHSAMLFATGNRYGGVKAVNFTGEVLTTVEALLGPTLLALLVFVLGRRAAR